MKQNRFGPSIGVLIAGMLLLSGCAAEGDELQDDVTLSEEAESSVSDDSSTESEAGVDEGGAENDSSSAGSSTQSARIPDDFWPGAPIPDFELTGVEEHDDRDYVLYMRGTDIEDDAHAIEALLIDEGFHRLAWGITEERGANGIFLTEDTRVTLTIEETNEGIVIIYGAGPYDPEG